MSIETKTKIQNTIKGFKAKTLTENALTLFQSLGYNTSRQAPLSKKTRDEFKSSFLDGDNSFNEDKAHAADWQYIDLLFQLSKEEMTDQNNLFDTGKVDNKIYESYLFFTLELKPGTYSRTVLSKITREINKVFSMPVFVLFKIENYLTLSIINRQLNKKDESKDVLKKVTLIKDIDIENPHRAHVEILFDLSLPELRKESTIRNFVDLHNAWQKTLDIKELNKQFYQKLANWYYWAKDLVEFPDDVEKDRELRNATATIRLITRIIFVWFIREKSLIPEAMFDVRFLKKILKNFNTPELSEGSTYYKTILQNLFFATLSTKKEERKFRGKEWKNGRNVDFGNQYVYRYEKLVSDIEGWENLFADVPFLNGGLFENLDSKTKKVLIDGFSEERRNKLHLPDFLFFSDDRSVDLNKTFDTKGKKYTVKGLVHILNEYKFTIAENTPIEEEVALDPELLGKVFENLLASFNPETKTTARKHTGSFYTPREIVNYMVDESLKIALSQKVAGKLPKTSTDDIKTGLEILFAYTEKEHAFNTSEVKAIVEAVAPPVSELVSVFPAELNLRWEERGRISPTEKRERKKDSDNDSSVTKSTNSQEGPTSDSREKIPDSGRDKTDTG